MDINLEKTEVAEYLGSILTQSAAPYIVVNVLSGERELVNHLGSEFNAENVIVTNKADLINLPRLFEDVRDHLPEVSRALILNVSHDLGWPCVEGCDINLEKTKTLDAREAVFASESSINHGSPFYDEEVL